MRSDPVTGPGLLSEGRIRIRFFGDFFWFPEDSLIEKEHREQPLLKKCIVGLRGVFKSFYGDVVFDFCVV